MAHLICPICRGALTLYGGSYRCPQGHTYDRSRYGYTNLLSGKAFGQHGDNREMILSRRRFLDSGAYAPLRDALCHAVKARHPKGGVLLDAGCGECYYTDKVVTQLSDPDSTYYGIDISREALRAAGVRRSVKEGALHLFVSGVYEMPFADESVDTILNLFAPLACEEYLRVLRPCGTLIMAIPDRRHLYSLKEILYDTPRENEVQDFALDGFALLSATPVRSEFTLEGTLIQDLFMMTPYYYRTPRTGRERLNACDTLTTEGAFLLLTYQKREKEST